jgi:hypothetical protein
MTKSKTGKSEDETKKDEAARAARERELRELMEKAEARQSGRAPSSHESPHDFVEKKMRDKPKS